STGKGGQGLIPIEGEPPLPSSSYGPDRAFVYLRLGSAPDAVQDRWAAELEEAGLPLVRIEIPDFFALGQEFFRWEVATATAGALMRINPFDQPDVESSKVETRRLTAEYEQTGALPRE